MIIVAGGSGTRMGSPVPKQFLLLEGKPVLMHVLETFAKAVPDAPITIALPAVEMERWNILQQEFACSVSHRTVPGGETRFHSVRNALAALPPSGLVAIHDGVRPLVSVALIRNVFEEAERRGNVIPVIPVNESIRSVDPSGSRPADRSGFRIVQTPQAFRLEEIRQAYQQAYRSGFTDDATVAEAAGFRIFLTDGEPVNIKITGPDDLLIAQALMSRSFQR